MFASRHAAVQRTERDIDTLRALISSFSTRGSSEDDQLAQAASILLRERTHQLFLLQWPSGAP